MNMVYNWTAVCKLQNLNPRRLAIRRSPISSSSKRALGGTYRDALTSMWSRQLSMNSVREHSENSLVRTHSYAMERQAQTISLEDTTPAAVLLKTAFSGSEGRLMIATIFKVS